MSIGWREELSNIEYSHLNTKNAGMAQEQKSDAEAKEKKKKNLKNKLLATLVEGDPKAPFSIATTPRYREGHYSFPWMSPLYPWS